MMNTIDQLKHDFVTFLNKIFGEPVDQTIVGFFTLNADPQKTAFGDISSNAAMILAKKFQQNPRITAQSIVDQFQHPLVQKIEIAGPGFLNFHLKPTVWQDIARSLFEQKDQFFKPSTRQKHNFDIEFVSANPTGPLHLGHGRGGIIGDVLTNVLRFLGHNVTKEYYINDAGAQIKKLGVSLKTRCQQEIGMDIAMPDDSYLGEYMIELAKRCIEQYGKDVVRENNEFFEGYAQEKILNQIKQTLQMYGIEFDVWFSELQLHESGAIEKALKRLKNNGYLFEKDDALWFRATDFGDDKDRVMRKSSGELTYVAADTAYLQNKIDRGFNKLIMILGHDHHSYAVRLQALLKALKLNDKATLDVILYQLVKMKAGGKQVRMSKRAGNIVTLREVIETVGKDVARFFYLNRKSDAQLDFDLELALKKNDENPVYYIQYAYVRTKSILAKANEHTELAHRTIDDAKYLSTDEALLLKKTVTLKDLLSLIGQNHQTHLLTYYVLELARTFHSYYAGHRVIDLDSIPVSRARLLLTQIVHDTLGFGFDLLGISKPEKM